MLRTTVGQLLVNEALPESMRRYDRVLDKDGVRDLFKQIAEEHPDKYAEIAHEISNIGHRTATETGGHSFGIRSIRTPASTRLALQALEGTLHTIRHNADLSDDDKELEVLKTTMAAQNKLRGTVFESAKAEGNPLSQQVVSGARGNPVNLNSLLGADLLYVDHRNRTIPMPVLRNYSQGLRPAEYFAGAFGARKGIVDLKLCLDEDTMVLMADYSAKAIKNIVVGDMVMGADRCGRLRPTRVTRVFDNGQRPCFLWRFRVGSCKHRFVELVATEEHKILAQIKAGQPGSTYAYRSVYTPTPLPLRESRPQRRTKNNTFVAYPSQGVETDGAGVHEPRALLLGLLLGDGHIPRMESWQLSCGDQQLLTDIAPYLAALNYKLTPPTAGYSYILSPVVPYQQQRTETGYGATGNPMKQWMIALGLADKKSPDKFIPAEVWSWNDTSVAALIAGLFSTDGCIDAKKKGKTVSVKFSSTSEQMVRELQRLLEVRFGIWTSSVRRIPVEMIPLGNYDQYTFALSNASSVRKFHKLIPLCGVRRTLLTQLLPRLSVEPRSTEVCFKIYTKTDVGSRNTFDIEVDNADHLFSLANGLIVSNSTANAGFLGKQLSQVSHRLIVSADDDEDGEPDVIRGLPVDTDDAYNAGALLAQPAGEYPRNTVLTPKIIKAIKAAGHDTILIRSPMVGGPRNGGVYARDAGVREKGRLAPIGDYVGIAAAQALAAPITQSSISSKHSGGVAGASAGAISGFGAINSLVQVPKIFPGGAAHSQLDGRVDTVRDAPQGGKYVTVNGQEHYVGADSPLTVKVGDDVEAGDTISEGIPHPGEVVKHKGIGEGRRYFMQAFHKTLQNSGISAHRRNVELLSRGLINHVRLNDEYGDWSPDDVIPYQTLERDWEPRVGSQVAPPRDLANRYLERPVLHYSIGTRLRPSVITHLEKYGVKQVHAHHEAPPFEPEMIRGMANVGNDPDWMAQLLGSYQSRNLLESARRGRVSDSSGTSYVPALAEGTNFGISGLTRGWKP